MPKKTLNRVQKVLLIDELIKKQKLPNGKEISSENIEKLIKAKANLEKQDLPPKMMTIEDLRAQFGKKKEREMSGNYLQEAAKTLVKAVDTIKSHPSPKERIVSKELSGKKKKSVVNLWKK